MGLACTPPSVVPSHYIKDMAEAVASFAVITVETQASPAHRKRTFESTSATVAFWFVADKQSSLWTPK
ncbi:hypothetical protein KSAC_00700 [Komagataeibacter saccharivorans]|nr:hypothetical protein KSAC_00700 [Komagataeibacter saccharivorans]